MIRLFTTIIFVLIFTVSDAQSPDKHISINLANASFEDFSKQIYEKSGITIYYKKDWVKDLKVSLEAENIPVISAVKKVLENSGLFVSEWNNHLVITRERELITQLPDYNKRSIFNDTSNVDTKKLTAAEERYITGRKATSTESIRIGSSSGKLTGGKAKVIGHLSDSETGEPLFNATMYIQELRTGAVSDINGNFTIMLKPGKYNAIFEILGYEKKKYQLNVVSDGSMKITLNKSVIEMKEVVVYGDRQMNIKAKDPGIEKIAVKSIKELPMMMGERDVLKVSLLLPGIVTTGEGSSGINVRGGSSDQNAFFINRIPVFNTSHLFGFFPSFNSDIIKDFVIYKGHIPAQYGGRLSSVFNIVTRQGNRKHFTAHGGVSPITASLVLEGPIKKDTSSALLSMRSSYSNWILKKIKDPLIRASKADFNDFSAAINYGVSKTQVSVFGYYSYDKFRLSDVNEYSYTNKGASLSVSQLLSNSIRGEFSLIGSEYFFKTNDWQEISAAYKHDYQIGHYEIRADFKHMLSEKHNLEYGVGGILYKLNRGKVEPDNVASLRIPLDLGKEKGIESSLYLSDSYDLTSWLNITAGLRYVMFTPLGPQTVYSYIPNSPVDSKYVEDTLYFGKNELIRKYMQPDLRAAVNIETDELGSIKFSYNQMHQNLFMLNNTITVAPNTQWKLADYHLEPSRSEQISLGVFRIIGQTGFDASIEGYFKRSSNYPEFKDGANFISTPQTETTLIQGKQKSYGLEVMIKRTNRKLEGWLSYTYARAFTKVDGTNSWDKINNGAEFPSNFDIPHSVNSVVNYHFSRRVTMSSIITYQSGKPITYPISIYYIDGVPYLDYSARNAYRIPDYFRTDVSLTIEGNLKRNKLLHSSFSISVYNLTGRKNPYSVYFKNENGRIKSYKYSVIGVPILTLSWIFKLGNYASE